MKNYKNYLIALLTGLLVISLSTQQAQSAGKSKEAKIIEYSFCVEHQFLPATATADLDSIFQYCAKYRP